MRGKIRGDNPGKRHLPAGTDDNLQRLAGGETTILPVLGEVGNHHDARSTLWDTHSTPLAWIRTNARGMVRPSLRTCGVIYATFLQALSDACTRRRDRHDALS